MRLWDRACCFWYGVGARLDGLWHLVRGHDLKWRCDAEPWIGYFGDIICENCPDTEGNVGLVIWCRHSRILGKLAETLCGFLGHPSFKHPTRYHPDLEVYFPATDSIYCTRCGLWIRRDATDSDERVHETGSTDL